MKVLTVAGTRPEFIRLALVFRRLAEVGIEHHLVHTGQNFDTRLSDIFFDELEIAAPDTYLGIRAERAGEQIGEIISRSEAVMIEERPDALLILGDTNSGLAAIPAARLNIPIFHMEAGNRCFDWSVPEEKNRRLIDHISTWLLPYTSRSREYLLAEGIGADRILVSGNPITDILEHFRPLWEASDVLERLGLEARGYVLVTAHRQESVDVPERLRIICDGLEAVAGELDLPVVWSVHPRTRGKLEQQGVRLDPRVQLHEPFGFADFVRLEADARCVISDSGTVQEECSLLKVPTVTCRDTTERPETVECGSNLLSGVVSGERILECVQVMLATEPDWESPYEGALHRNVAERVVKFLVGSTR
ncbi:MAG: UDP-N-acetylglucosamine 2-epimerase (non-hydrolyzing) [Solirubrobacteraceae bacterium]|nr:UDP-N-acetylglucosamine 2-epimerase (non-hydrolyzing) [Solirubrobacteraceae bacterium]